MTPAPQRIASLLSSATEMLFGLGLGDRVVAISHECDYPPQALTRPRVTYTNIAVGAASGDIDNQVRELTAAGAPLYEIDADHLAELRPDLMVTQAQCDVCAVKYDDVISLVRERSELAHTQVVALNPMSLKDVFADIACVAEAAGCPTAADAYLASLRARVAAVRQITGELAPAECPRVACIEWIEPLMAAANWMPDMIAWAGGQQSLATAGRHSTYTTWDDIVAFDPECVLVMPCGFDLPRTLDESHLLTRLPGWSRTTAARHGRIYAVDGNAYFNRSGPRLVDSLELLARLLHPQRFGLQGNEPGEPGIWQRLA